MKRFQARRGNGRFQRNTLENTAGLHANLHTYKRDGTWCGRFNPSNVGEPRPRVCQCGEEFEPDAPAPFTLPLRGGA